MHHGGKSRQVLKAGTWRWELKQGPWRTPLTGLVPLVLLSYFIYAAQTYLPRDGTVHSRLGPST